MSPLRQFPASRRKLVQAGEIDGPFDIVLVTVKAFGLPAAIEDFAPAVGPDTMILPVLNGMKHIDDLQARFGAERVVGGVCRVSTTLDDAGPHRCTWRPCTNSIYGELDGADSSARIEALHAFMSDAGFDTRNSARTSRRSLWNKWILLATLGGICTLARGNGGRDRRHRGRSTRSCDAVSSSRPSAVATAAGHPAGAPHALEVHPAGADSRRPTRR